MVRMQFYSKLKFSVHYVPIRIILENRSLDNLIHGNKPKKNHLISIVDYDSKF